MARAIAEIEEDIRALSPDEKRDLLRALVTELDTLRDSNAERASRAAAQRRYRDEIRADLAAANEYVAQHGSFADLAREHFASPDDDPV